MLLFVSWIFTLIIISEASEVSITISSSPNTIINKKNNNIK